MGRFAFATLLSTGIESALAHPGGSHAVQHSLEHLAMALVLVVSALMLLRRVGQQRGPRRPLRVRHRND